MATKRIKIRPFQPSSMRENPVIYAIGKRGSGKSTLLEYLMFLFSRKADFGCAVTGTLNSGNMFRKHVPDSMIYENGYNNAIGAKLISNAKACHEQASLGKTRPRKAFLVLDDCMADKKKLNTPAMRDLHMNGRNYGVIFINAVQYMMDMPSDFRSQVDYVFVFKEANRNNKRRLYDNFFSMFETQKQFSTALDKCTKDYHCMVLDTTKDISDISKCIFIFKAQYPCPPFKMFRPVFWSLDIKCKVKGSFNASENLLKPLVRRSKTSPQDSKRKQIFDVENVDHESMLL